VCFFLPWVNVSCGAAKDTLSGFDLARHDHAALWFIPVLMLGAILLALVKAWKSQPLIYAVVIALSGAIVVYLMNRERLRVGDETALIAAQLTGWFWLALFATIVVIVSGLAGGVGKRSP